MMKIYVDDDEELEDLREWMDGHAGFTVTLQSLPARPNAQGSVLDFLSVAFAAGGPVVAAVKALQLWIEARATTVRVTVGDNTVEITTPNAATVLPQVAEMAKKMLEAGDDHSDDPA